MPPASCVSDSPWHNMTEFGTISTFFHLGVSILPNDYYITNNTECDICQEGDNAGNEPCSASVVQIRQCRHIFHNVCLAEWMVRSFTDNGSATCPMCRAVLVRDPDLDHRENSGAALGHTVHDFLQERLAQIMTHNPQTPSEEYKQAKEIVLIAEAMLRFLDFHIDPVFLRTAMIFVEDYEATHPLTRLRNRLDGFRWRMRDWCARHLGLHYALGDLHQV